MTRVDGYFLHVGYGSSGLVTEQGETHPQFRESPVSLTRETTAFDGLGSLVRGRALPARDASKFGLPHGCDARPADGVQFKTRTVPILPVPTISSVKVIASALTGSPLPLFIGEGRALRYGKTVESTNEEPSPEHPDGQVEVTTRKTRFLELSHQRGLKVAKYVLQGEIDPYSDAGWYIMAGIKTLPVTDGPMPRDDASIGIMPLGLQFVRLSPEVTATFGVGSAPMKVDGADVIGSITTYQQKSFPLPIVGRRVAYRGITTQLVRFKPSEEHPEGRTVVSEIGFSQYAPKPGYKLKLGR